MILSSETQETDAEQMLEFYKARFASVELVKCGQCGTHLAFECSGGDGMGMQPNELGKFIIPIGSNLLSSRVRLDETPEGERMMGYQCGAVVFNAAYPAAKKKHEDALAAYDQQYEKDVAKAKKAKKDEPKYSPPVFSAPEYIRCGNDTRIADVERGTVPVGPTQVTLTPFEKHRIREEIKEQRVKPNFKRVGNVKHFETFEVERIK